MQMNDGDNERFSSVELRRLGRESTVTERERRDGQ